MSLSVALIGAHPDDVEIGMGGTVKALTNSGYKIILIDLTNGEPTPYGSPAIRATESNNAATLLGIHERITLKLTNRELFDSVEARKEVASLIRKFKPEVLFIPYWEDAHPDHIEAERIASAARFYSKFVKSDLPYEPHHPRKIFHYFSLHLKARVLPSFIFDISKYINEKMASINAYKSQFLDHPTNAKILEQLRNENSYWGGQIGVDFGEPFICRENLRITSPEFLLSL